MRDQRPLRSPGDEAGRPGTRSFLALLTTGLLVGGSPGAGGCGAGQTGDGAGDGGAVSDASGLDGSGEGSCEPTPPDPTFELVCRSWQCDAVAWPTCWRCAAEPDSGLEGEACLVPGGGSTSGRCVAGECVVESPPPDPADPGPGATTTATYDLELSGGLFGTTIPLTIHLPDDPGPHPVVVFTHGFMLSPADYASYGTHLASWRYVVVMPDLPGSIISPTSHKQLKEYLIAVLDWIEAGAADQTGPLLGRADPACLGLSGHSIGAKISLLASTEDGRPGAAFTIDPVDAAGTPFGTEEDYPSVTPELMDQLSIPLGLLGETVNAVAEGIGSQACAPEEDNFHQYYLHATSPAIEIEALNANHVSFLDDPDCGPTCSACPAGTDDPAVTRRLTRRYLTAFLNVFLRGEDEFRYYLTGPAMARDIADGFVLSSVRGGF